MQTRSAVEEQVFTAVHRLCYAGLDTPALLHEMVRHLARAIPMDGHCFYEADPASGLIVRLASEPVDEARGRFFLENVYFEDDVAQHRRLAASRRPVAVESTAGPYSGKDDPTVRRREFLSSRGVGFDVRCAFASSGQLWGGISLFREPSRRNFDERELTLLGRLAPHIGTGLRTAALRLQAPPSRAVRSGPAVLVLDRRGRVVEYTAAAEHWLGELADLGPGWQDGCGLPAAIWVALGALRTALHPAMERDLAHVPRICVRTRTGQWLMLHASLTEAIEGRSSTTVVVIEPLGLRQVAWLRCIAYGLSEREQEVVELVVRGASTRQIATKLCISDYTVQAHLSHIFEKVGVRGRRALVKHVYFDSLFPA